MQENSGLSGICGLFDDLTDFIKKVEDEGVLSVTETREALKQLGELQMALDDEFVHVDDVLEYVEDHMDEIEPVNHYALVKEEMGV